MPRVTAAALRDRKKAGEKIAVLTAYDYPSAQLQDKAGVDAILVGDSVGMVVCGRDNTLRVTVDQIVYHVEMVSRATQRALVIADMPFGSYQVSSEEALRNAARFVSEGGAQSVKLEGPASSFGGAIGAILRAGIPVMGHIGLTPQSIHLIGGYKIQGRDAAGRARLKQEALELEAAGCFAIVLECVPADLAADISQSLQIPTIGIGAGPHCDGQVLVMHDMLGMGKYTKFSKIFENAGASMAKAFGDYVSEVKSGKFPTKEHSFE